MKTKTFKIGERAYYGIWRVEVESEIIRFVGIDWDTKKVKDTKEFRYWKCLIPSQNYDWILPIFDYAENISDYHHAEMMIDFVREATGVPK